MPPTQEKATLAAASLLAKARYSEAFQRYWANCAPARYRALGISLAPGLPWELRLPRAFLGRLLAARSGHGDFAEYHERLGHEDATLKCSCGARKDPEHFLHCSRAPATLRGSADRILATKRGVERFYRWCETTAYFSVICPNRPPPAI